MTVKFSNLVESFVQFYGANGTINRPNVSKFLSNIHMDKSFLHRLKSQGNCPRHNFSSKSWYQPENLTDLILAIWDTAQTPDCHTSSERALSQESMDALDQSATSALEVWGYGLLCVTVINLCAVLGVIFMPFMGRQVYKLLMTFMTALAVGSLLATALLILLPDSLQLAYIHEEVTSEHSVFKRFNIGASSTAGWEQFLAAHPWYIWRSCAVFGGIYMFFILERALKELLGWRSTHNHGHHHGHDSNSNGNNQAHKHNHSEDNVTPMGSMVIAENAAGAAAAVPADPKQRNFASAGREPNSPRSSLRERLAAVQPVAWMILMGDGLHNFIDGLSLGAGFSRSTLTGVSISLAVLCEELPHELGDFAILLSAGMSVKMALATNLLSAGLCYIGFVIGVLLGEVAGASIWIFGFGAGMFLYISLVDMMPEVNDAVDGAAARKVGRAKIFLAQNLGFLVGYALILIIALFGGDIKFA